MAIELAPPPAATRRYWDRETDDEVLCIDVHAETHDVKSFTFVSPAGKHFAFQAGQYFMFEAEIGGDVHSRCYSISSSPLRQNAFTVTVKRVAGGVISNWFHDVLVPGTRIKASGPLGLFTCPGRPSAKLLFLSGGSGITPVMAMTRELADLGVPMDVVFLHAARSPKDFIFADDLAGIARRAKGLRLHLLPEAIDGDRAWPGLTGRLSAGRLRKGVRSGRARRDRRGTRRPRAELCRGKLRRGRDRRGPCPYRGALRNVQGIVLEAVSRDRYERRPDRP
jgi:ferredoxin-NADP reductase